MLDVGPKDPFQVAPPLDQRPVQTLGPNGSHPPLGEGIRVRGPDRRADDPGALCLEHGIEGARELRVPVVDQEARGGPLFVECPGDVSCLLGDPGPIRIAGRPGTCTLLVPSSTKNSTYSVRSHTVSTVRKSQAMIPEAWWRRNSLHVGPRRGAGPR